MKCECYQPDFGGTCNGTKERDHCMCNGEMESCDFYPEVREKAIESDQTEQAVPRMDAVTFLKQMNRMCDGDCEDCPIEREIGDDIIDCIRWTEKYPEKAVELVSQWATAHPEPITWNQWLHYIQSYYSGFSSRPFIEWLNTPIPEDAKKKFNIG